MLYGKKGIVILEEDQVALRTKELIKSRTWELMKTVKV